MTDKAAAIAGEPGRPTWLGHPRGLFVLFFAEMWERFSYYGMRALLIFYLVQHWMFSDGQASVVYGAYTALVYITPVIGGYLADRWLGQRKAVLYGAILLTFGHLLMAVEGEGGQSGPAINVFWLALSFIIVGSGFLKANISVIVGELYSRTDPRRPYPRGRGQSGEPEGRPPLPQGHRPYGGKRWIPHGNPSRPSRTARGQSHRR